MEKVPRCGVRPASHGSNCEGKPEPVPFNLGNLVEVIVENSPQAYELDRIGTYGMVGKIRTIDCSETPLEIELANGRAQWYKETWVKHTTKAPDFEPDPNPSAILAKL